MPGEAESVVPRPPLGGQGRTGRAQLPAGKAHAHTHTRTAFTSPWQVKRSNLTLGLASQLHYDHEHVTVKYVANSVRHLICTHV